MARTLRISLLGDVVMQLEDELITGLPSRAAEALLIYLVCNRRPIAREKLAELLWAERSPVQALTNLRTILTPLRRELGDYLLVTRQTLAFDHGRDYWLDVAEFERGFAAQAASARPVQPDPDRIRQLQSVLDLYQGDFLDGFYLKGGHGFEEWATVQRERLRHLAREGFRRLASAQLEGGAYLAGSATAARWRQLDPYSEEACRTQMWLLTRSGQRHLALRSYQDFRQLLSADIGVEPGPATAALDRQLRTLELPPPLEVPAPPTAFVAREAEVDALVSLILARGNRLLTLTGPGGIGKTRLAIEAARAAAQRAPGRFLHGTFFASLAALTSAESLPVQIADTLHVQLQGSEPPGRQLLAHLVGREVLLILDNVEHLLKEPGVVAALLVDLLRQAPGVKVLLTSQGRLNLYEEVVFDVPGLAVAQEGDEGTTPSGAAQLFLTRARQVQREFEPTAADLVSVAQLCRLVKGTPLAIELAAGWLRRYDCGEIVRGIEQSPDFLASTYHDLPERQRSLRSVFEYSWQLLTPVERAALGKLTVFGGGFAAEAADAVAGPRAPLADLADRSLVQPSGAGRFDLHPLLRGYAAEKLALDPQVQQRAADDHAAFYLSYLVALGGGESPQQRAAIRLELANIRGAWEWAARRRMVDLLGGAAAALHGFFSVQSWFQEGIDLFARSLAALGAASSQEAAIAGLRAELLGRKARMHLHIGQLVEARADLQAALIDLPQIEDPRRRGSALDSLVITHYYAGDFSQAATLARESLRLAEQSDDRRGVASAFNFMGSCAKALGNYPQAQICFQRSAEAYLQLPDEIGAAMAYNNLGNLLQSTGDWPGAQRYYQQSSELFKAHDHAHGAATTLANAGKLARKQGAYDQAQALLNESLAMKRQMGDLRGEAVALAGLGDVALAMGAYAEARARLSAGLELAQQSGDMKLWLEALTSFAELLAMEADRDGAARLLGYILQHQGASQEAREQAQRLAEQLGKNSQHAGAGWQDERALLDWLRRR
ncbi:MAG TPA: tetratricopeptide repeat protein [Anaerolineae bacterium]|nr:tetratricopeptide repeat protein [Anaerolineae bacterium]HNU04199.1 tetratricopeptide repeat protein [Anaerolineae bacterium]